MGQVCFYFNLPGAIYSCPARGALEYTWKLLFYMHCTNTIQLFPYYSYICTVNFFRIYFKSLKLHDKIVPAVCRTGTIWFLPALLPFSKILSARGSRADHNVEPCPLQINADKYLNDSCFLIGETILHHFFYLNGLYVARLSSYPKHEWINLSTCLNQKNKYPKCTCIPRGS